MYFASDNGAPAAPEILAAVVRANQGPARSYGADPLTARAQDAVRTVFEAPEAVVRFVVTGTAANALALALLAPPWSAILCHQGSHVLNDECGAPEMYTGGARPVGLPGAHGRIAPAALASALADSPKDDLGVMQPAVLSLTNVTEAGTVYAPGEIAALAAMAHAAGLSVHLDGARFANALVATGATPAEMSWKAGVDVLSLGGTKNGLFGAEAVVIFDPARTREFDLRSKRAGHLLSKQRFLSAQIEAWLTDGLWLRLAARANDAMSRIAAGLGSSAVPAHPVQANMAFLDLAPGTRTRLRTAGAVFHDLPAPEGRARLRLVTAWNTSDAEVDSFLQALHAP